MSIPKVNKNEISTLFHNTHLQGGASSKFFLVWPLELSGIISLCSGERHRQELIKLFYQWITKNFQIKEAEPNGGGGGKGNFDGRATHLGESVR